MNAEDMAAFQEAMPLLAQVKVLSSSQGKEVDDLTKEEAMAINMTEVAKSIGKALMTMLDKTTPGEKLSRVASALNSS